MKSVGIKICATLSSLVSLSFSLTLTSTVYASPLNALHHFFLYFSAFSIFIFLSATPLILYSFHSCFLAFLSFSLHPSLPLHHFSFFFNFPFIFLPTLFSLPPLSSPVFLLSLLWKYVLFTICTSNIFSRIYQMNRDFRRVNRIVK